MRNWIWLSACLLLLASCKLEKKEKKNDVAVEDVPIEAQFMRFDRDLATIDTATTETVKAGYKALVTKYPDFAADYFGPYMTLIDPRRSEKEQFLNLQGFLKHPPVRILLDTLEVVYPDLRETELEVGQMMARYQKLFPDKPKVKIMTMYSEYQNAILGVSDSLIAVSLEFFLGANDPHYPHDIIPNYVGRSLDKTHLPGYIAEKLAENVSALPTQMRLLDQLIYNGKKQYVMELLLPEAADSVLFRWTGEQMKFTKSQEQELWSHITSQNLLYSTENDKIRKFVTPAPNIPGIPPQAPGGIANYTGLQIIRQLVANQPTMTLQQILALADSQKILELAKYKPAR